MVQKWIMQLLGVHYLIIHVLELNQLYREEIQLLRMKLEVKDKLISYYQSRLED